MSTQFTNRQWRLPNEENKNKVSNYSMDFDGSQYIDTNQTLSSSYSALTLSAWVNYTSISDYSGTIFGQWIQNNNSGSTIICYTVSNKIQVYLGPSATSLTSTTTLTTGTWYNVILRFDGSTMKLYINGIEEDSISFTSINNSAQNLILGAYSNNTQTGYQAFLNGKLDGVSIFNYALTDGTGGTVNQIAALYGSSSTGIGNPMSLNPKPVFYAPLGDQDVFNGSNYLVPNSSLKDYVFDFDADYIDLGSSSYLNSAQNVTVSAWINSDNYSSGSEQNILNDWNHPTANGHFRYDITSTGVLRISVKIDGSNYAANEAQSFTFTNGRWYNVIFVYDGTLTGNTNICKLYIDGQPQTVTNLYENMPSSFLNSSSSLNIGRFGSSSHRYFNGKLSNVQIFNTSLSATGSNSVETLYNNGSPLTSMTGFSSLVSWYKLNASDTYDSSTGNWTIEDHAGSNDGTSSGMTQANLVASDLSFKTSYSPFALDFDGTNDYISLPTITLTDNWSVSVWMNQTTLKQRAQAVGTTLTTPTNNFWNYGAQVPNGGANAGKLIYYNYSTSQYTPLSNNRLDDGNWHNWIITYDHSTTTLKCYIDGQENYSETYNTGTGNTINRISNNFASNYWLGQLSNISIWNTALTSAQVSEIYSEGVPQNLNNHSAYSNLVSWWQLGSNSSFNTNWTVLDEKGSNDGVSSNMTEADIVDGVGSYANGLSSGMGGDEVIGSAPFSDANSLSINMDVLDRVEDTPA